MGARGGDRVTLDGSQAIDVVLHLDVITPYDERTDQGWDLDVLEHKIRRALDELFPRYPRDLEIDSIEIIECATN